MFKDQVVGGRAARGRTLKKSKSFFDPGGVYVLCEDVCPPELGLCVAGIRPKS